MHIYNGFEAMPLHLQNTVVTVGSFDGVHVGHQALIQRMVELKATHRYSKVVVFTFDPHPRSVLQPSLSQFVLTPLDQKIDWLGKLGVDVVVVQPFTPTFSKITAEDFVTRILVHALGAAHIVVGPFFRFGAGGKGDLALLRALTAASSCGVDVQPPVLVGDERVSSTRIRECVRNGKMEEVRTLLGRRFSLAGVVVHGHKRGKAIGFPTANVRLNDRVIPKIGIYATWVTLETGDRYSGATYIGENKTFGESELVFETHLLDFDDDLYDKTINVEFVEWVRGDRTFTGVPELVSQIAKDVASIRTILK